MKTYVRFGLYFAAMQELMRKLICSLIFSGLFIYGFCQDTLYINTGELYFNADTLNVLRFNSTALYDTTNQALEFPSSISASFILFNTDSVDHELRLGDIDSWSVNLPSGEYTSVTMPSLEMGTYRYYCTGERARVLGLSGLIKCGIESNLQFHWNLAEWMPSRVDSASSGAPVDYDIDYLPRYFSINSKIFPNTTSDEDAYIALNLGDTCTISITNSGDMDHVFHFHGFHVLWVSSTVQTSRVGWTKDTVPIKKGEAMTLQLIANQAGMYPVHNHNLIAVTNAGFYPGGMITMINVQP